MLFFLLGGGENISAWYSKLDACYKHAQRGGGSGVCPPDYFIALSQWALAPIPTQTDLAIYTYNQN